MPTNETSRGLTPHVPDCAILAKPMHYINTIFEAGFTSDDLTVFVDVLHRNCNGWDVIEIKAATRVEDMHAGESSNGFRPPISRR